MVCKIVFVAAHFDRSGPCNVLYGILLHLDYSKYSISLIVLNKDNNTRLDDIKKLPINVFLLPKINKFNFLALLKEVNALLDVINPDIIHSHDLRSHLIGYFNRRRCDVIATVHGHPDMQFINKYGLICGSFIRLMLLFLYRNIPNIIPCSCSLRNDLFEHYGISSKYVVQNGVQSVYNLRGVNDGFVPMLDNRHIWFISVGRFSEEKNFKFLLDTFSNKKYIKYGLVILGDGKLYNKYRLKYSSDRIILPGHVKNIGDYLLSSNYYISSSKSEGMPLSVLEALSAGLPLLLSNISPHREIINSVKSYIGQLYDYPTFDVSLATLTLHNYEEMKNYAFDCYNKYFSYEVMSNNYQNIYERIVKNK
jgi:glycosyltransferase involved in cell wall biosynthesis